MLTLVVANVTAVYQNSVKRMLAYSSVAQVGYILLGLISDSVKFEGPLFYYLASYAVTSLVAFGILYIIETTTGSSSLEAFAGLYKRSPFAAVCMTIALLSLAGIPPFAGFFAKYTVLSMAIEGHYIGLVILAVITSLIGVYYYFKPIIAAFSPSSKDGQLQIDPVQKVVIGILTILIVLMGLLPDSLIGILG